jgi:hypothetical protein
MKDKFTEVTEAVAKLAFDNGLEFALVLQKPDKKDVITASNVDIVDTIEMFLEGGKTAVMMANEQVRQIN